MGNLIIPIGILLFGLFQEGKKGFSSFTEKLDFEFIKIKKLKAGFNKISGILIVLVKNDTKSALGLDGFDLGVYVNNILIGKVRRNIGLSVKGESSAIVEIPFELETINIINALNETEINSGIMLRVLNTPIKIKGNASAKGVSFPLDYTFTILDKLKDE